MKQRKKSAVRRLCFLAGVGLLVAAAGVLIAWQWGIRVSEQRSEGYVHTLRTLMPEPQGTVLEERQDNSMPALSLDGTDFIGILELPRYGSALPVCAEWGKLTRYPCCFGGSVYDGSMQIGGTTQKGQYDFYREISVGDALYFTDMTGGRYAYEVSQIRYETHADPSALECEEAELTLFVKNVYAFEYILIFCNVKG